jgi:hypothetical protein
MHLIGREPLITSIGELAKWAEIAAGVLAAVGNRPPGWLASLSGYEAVAAIWGRLSAAASRHGRPGAGEPGFSPTTTSPETSLIPTRPLNTATAYRPQQRRTSDSADVSEFHLCILMQQPVSPFVISEAEEVSGLALTLAFWVGQIDSVRCPGRLNGVSGGVQIILSARRREAGSCRPARARRRLAARAADQRRVGTADQHQRRPDVQHPPGCPTRCTSRAHGSRGCTRSARWPGAAR